ncbi:Arm DNA-binding domain-containing protein [Spirabiliibacterium mucosae]|uniref:Arm DNA-binding domain-containing protein n=1 Tax=Spirabiliibacterium mucosae TaxID=28156 RepID=UPI001F3F410E|nr:Arm DNA-binding domain-containing protein [Spirabiliibacterium mucosae]
MLNDTQLRRWLGKKHPTKIERADTQGLYVRVSTNGVVTFSLDISFRASVKNSQSVSILRPRYKMRAVACLSSAQMLLMVSTPQLK